MKIFWKWGGCDEIICTCVKVSLKKMIEKNRYFLADKKKVVFLCRKWIEQMNKFCLNMNWWWRLQLSKS